MTYRHPGLLAKTITTLDVLSGGRAELGLGAAWYEREHRGLGVPFPPLRERYERLEETLQICFQMWSDDNGPYEGTHYRLAETLCSPQPVSSPRPRVLIGGGGERKTLRLVATYADACNIIGDAATVAHKVEVLRRHCDEVGREFADIEVTALIGVADDAGPDAIMHEAEALNDVGVQAIVIRAARIRAVAVARRDVGAGGAEVGHDRLIVSLAQWACSRCSAPCGSSRREDPAVCRPNSGGVPWERRSRVDLGAPFSRKVSPCSPCPLVARDRRHGDQRYSESRPGKAQARRCS